MKTHNNKYWNIKYYHNISMSLVNTKILLFLGWAYDNRVSIWNVLLSLVKEKHFVMLSVELIIFN